MPLHASNTSVRAMALDPATLAVVRETACRPSTVGRAAEGGRRRRQTGGAKIGSAIGKNVCFIFYIRFPGGRSRRSDFAAP
jgi:hypothetical protein